MDNMYRRGYGRGPMFYPPQQVDPNIVSFGQVQMYDPEHYDRVAMAMADRQNRYDQTNAAIAQHLSDIGAADIESRHMNEYMARMNEGLEDLYSGIMQDYQGDVGRASARVIKSLSRDRGLMTQLVQDTAREREALKEFQQLAVSGNQPHILESDGSRRAMTFEEFHKNKLGNFDTQGNFRRGEFIPLRGAADVSGYLERHISKALNDIQKGGNLQDAKGVAGMLVHWTEGGMEPGKLSEYLDTHGDEIARQVINEVPNFAEELENISSEDVLSAVKNYVKPIIMNQVTHKHMPNYLQAPKVENKEKSSQAPSGAFYPTPVDASSEAQKEAKEVTKLRNNFEKQSLLVKQLDTLRELSGYSASMEKSKKWYNVPELLTGSLNAIDSILNTDIGKTYSDGYEQRQERFTSGTSTYEDAFSHGAETIAGLNPAVLLAQSNLASMGFIKDALTYDKLQEESANFISDIFGASSYSISSTRNNFKNWSQIMLPHGVVKLVSDKIIPPVIKEPKKDTEEYKKRSDLLELIWLEGKEAIDNFDLARDDNGLIYFKTVEKTDVGYRARNQLRAMHYLDRIMTKPEEAVKRNMEKMFQEVESYAKENPTFQLYLGKLKGENPDMSDYQAVSMALETWQNTKDNQRATVSLSSALYSGESSVGKREADEKERFNMIRRQLRNYSSGKEDIIPGSSKEVNRNNKLLTQFMGYGDTEFVDGQVNFGDFTLTLTLASKQNNKTETIKGIPFSALVPAEEIPTIEAVKTFIDSMANLKYWEVDNTGKPVDSNPRLVFGNVMYESTLEPSSKKDKKYLEPTITAYVSDGSGGYTKLEGGDAYKLLYTSLNNYVHKATNPHSMLNKN